MFICLMASGFDFIHHVSDEVEINLFRTCFYSPNEIVSALCLPIIFIHLLLEYAPVIFNWPKNGVELPAWTLSWLNMTRCNFAYFFLQNRNFSDKLLRNILAYISRTTCPRNLILGILEFSKPQLQNEIQFRKIERQPKAL